MFKDIKEEDERSDSGAEFKEYPDDTKNNNKFDVKEVDSEDELSEHELNRMQSGILDALS